MDQRLRQTKESSQQSEADAQLSARSETREASTPESLLARDAAANPVPPSVGERLSRSLAVEPTPKPRSWWQRLFNRP